MTTIAVRAGKMVSDGQVSFGDRIDQTSLKKVRKINGCLVGGAGRLSSVLQFFSWFEDWSNAQLVQGDSPHVQVFIPEGIDDEDFTGLVEFTDGVIFMYEGGKRCYEIVNSEYYAIGSGADFALAAMDSGATAEEAVRVAAKRDVFTGGEIFIEELDEEVEELTPEKAEEMSKEELLDYMFGKKVADVDVTEELLEDNEDVLVDSENYIIFQDGFTLLYGKNPDQETSSLGCILDRELSLEQLQKSKREDLVYSMLVLTGAEAHKKSNKKAISQVIYDALLEIYKEKTVE